MKPTRAGYELVKKEQDVVLRGDQQQQTTKILRGMLYENPTWDYRGGYGGPEALPGVGRGDRDPQPGMQLAGWEAHNRSGGAETVGIGYRWASRKWNSYDYDDNSGDPTITRSDGFQSRTQTDLFSTIGTPADEDGLLIVSKRPFDWVSANVTVASNDAANSTADFDYWGPAGAWVTVAANQAILDTLSVATELATGEAVFCWSPPHDWSPVQEGDLLHRAGIDIGCYALLYRWGGVPDTTDPAFTGLEIGTMVYSGENLGDDGLWENEIADYQDLWGDGVVALFSTAAAGNMVAFQVRTAG